MGRTSNHARAHADAHAHTRTHARPLAGLIALSTSLSLAAAQAEPAGRKPPPPPAPAAACETAPADLAAHTAAFDAFTKAAFDAALAKAKLRLAPLTARMLSPDDPTLARVQPGTTFALGKDTALFYTTEQGYGAPAFEFVVDARGGIHRLVRDEHIVETESHLLCGCGPMGGGAVPPRFAVVYLLPPGTHYEKAPATVRYDAKHVSLRYDMMVGGQRCQPPP